MSLSRALLVGAGLFAPGHLGELTPFVPFELVDDVLRRVRAGERRLRLLPSRVGVFFVLALGLFPEVGYLGVWRKLTAGLEGLLEVAVPSEKALRDLRRRLGSASFEELFGVLAVPLARPSTPGTHFAGYRTVSFDGCSSIKVPDQAGNRSWLGKITYRRGEEGYPSLKLMTLVETGTRGLLGAVFGPEDRGESAYASQLIGSIAPDMLVLADQGLDADLLMSAITRQAAQFLIRVHPRRRPKIHSALSDGSYLTVIDGHRVRIIEASISVTCADGSNWTSGYRLATSLTDHHRHPASILAELYHERWEHESAYYALRHTLMNRRVLRSSDRAGITQEMWALLTIYQILRHAMVAATSSRPGIDPDRASFTIALNTAREQLITAQGVLTPGPGRISQAILAGLLPRRRRRLSDRKVKSPQSRYAYPSKNRPPTSSTITHLAISITAPPPGAHYAQAPDPASRLGRIITLLATDPHHDWHYRHIADALQARNNNVIKNQLRIWADNGLLRKTGPGLYRNVLTPAPNP